MHISTTDLPKENEIKEFGAVCVAKYKGVYYAFATKCPHASAPLSAGFIDNGGNVVCPVHYYKWSIRTGRNVTDEGSSLKRYVVELKEDGLHINQS